MASSSDGEDAWHEVSPSGAYETSSLLPLHSLTKLSQEIEIFNQLKAGEKIPMALSRILPQWTVSASILEMVHLYSIMAIFAEHHRSTKGKDMADYDKLLVRSVSHSSNGDERKAKKYSWLTMKDALSPNASISTDTELEKWVKDKLMNIHHIERTHSGESEKSANIQSHQNIQARGDLPVHLTDFCIACLSSDIPMRLCFSLNGYGEIQRECAWESHKYHAMHLKEDSHRECTYALWTEVFCVESARWIPVLTSIYEKGACSPESVHYTWGSAVSATIGARNCMAVTNTNMKAASSSRRKSKDTTVIIPADGPLHLYALDITPKYTSNLPHSYSARKWKDDAYSSSSESDCSSDESNFSNSTESKKQSNVRGWISRLGRKFGEVQCARMSRAQVNWKAIQHLNEVQNTSIGKRKQTDIIRQQSAIAQLISNSQKPHDMYPGQCAEAILLRRFQARGCPVPSSAQAFRTHPLYILQENLGPRQAICIKTEESGQLVVTRTKPPHDFQWRNVIGRNADSIAGLLKNTVVFHRAAIVPIRTRCEWTAKKKLIPKPDELPVNVLHSKKCVHKEYKPTVEIKKQVQTIAGENSCRCPQLFGRWQLIRYDIRRVLEVHEDAVGSGLHRNAHGNIDLLMPNMIYRLFKAFEEKARYRWKSETLLYRFLSSATEVLDSSILWNVLSMKSIQSSWWAQNLKNFPHDSVRKVFIGYASLETSFAQLQPLRGVIYIPYETCAVVIDAENAYRAQQRKKRPRKHTSQSTAYNHIDYVPVVINFDRVKSHLYLPRKIGVIVREKDYIANDIPKLYAQWVAYWKLCEDRKRREELFAKWKNYFQFLAACMEMNERYGSMSKCM